METKYKYLIQDREAGNVIELLLSLEEAQMLVADWEKEDKDNNTYTPNFYEIVEMWSDVKQVI